MVDYVTDLVVTAGSSVSAPCEKVLDLAPGILSTINVFFPPGPQGEAKIRVLQGAYQIFPGVEGQWLAFDGALVPIVINRTLPQGESQVTIQGIGPNANFDHTITVWLTVIGATGGGSVTILTEAASRIARLFGGI